MKNLPIIEVGYGISSRYDDGIEIHRYIKGDLRRKILTHERNHDQTNNYTRKDFYTDFNSSNAYFKDSLIFALKHPSGLIGFFPFMYSYYYKIMTFNWSSIPPFLYFGVIFSLFWWLIFKINPLQSIICYILVILLVNIILLGVTHYLIKKSGLDY